MATPLRRALRAYPELFAVLLAAAFGLGVQAPLRWLVARHGIDVLLAALVFTIAVTITVGEIREAGQFRRRLLLCLVTGVTLLPAMAWAVAHLVSAGPLRRGMLTVGLAPCEIASVATTAMAGGQAAAAAVILIGSTLLSVVVAGPILILEAGHASIKPLHLIANLAVVVLLPLAAGVTLRALYHVGAGRERVTSSVTTFTLAGLVALIAAEVHLSTSYIGVLGASIVFVLASAGVGRLLGLQARDSLVTPIVLTTSMRDFAVAAGIATSAFGPTAAAPLGLYGIVVLVWGTVVAGTLRRQHSA